MIRDLQPGGSPFRTLWTTRDDWSGVQRYRLDKLDDAAARQLLASYIDESRLDAEPDAIATLLRWFDGLPLGLELAARYLALDDWLSIADYLDELTLTHESLQANREMRYPGGVEAAIAVSWARLNPETEDGWAALRLALRLALFGAAPIPVLADWKQAWRKPLQRLVGLNLVDRDRVAVALHPLVRQFVRGRLAVELSEEEGEQLRREVAAAIVEQGKQIEDTFTMAQAQGYAPWVPHLEEVAAGLLAWVADEEVITPCKRISYFYYGQGLYELAEPWMSKRVAVARERLGDRHADTAAALNDLAVLYREQGKYEAAEPLFQEALAIFRESLPANHPQLATHLNNLAELYEKQGKYKAAEPLCREALTIQRETLAANDPSLATGLTVLGALYRAQGKYEAAEPLLQEALAILRESLPANHPNLANSLNNLGALYYAQGKYEAAEPLFQEALAIGRESLPANHPELASHLNNLAGLYQAQGKYEAAEPLFQEALAIDRESLPANHPWLANHLSNLARLYRDQGKYESAEPLYQEALAIGRESLPANHPNLAVSLSNIAELYRLQEKYDQAESLCKEALKIDRESLPVGHPYIAVDLYGLGSIYQSQEKYDEAEHLFLEALSILLNGSGEENPYTQKCWGYVTDFYQTALAAGHPDTRLRNHPLGHLIRSRLQ
jgi:tetratricopeptide (TPR) repeat protein